MKTKNISLALIVLASYFTMVKPMEYIKTLIEVKTRIFTRVNLMRDLRKFRNTGSCVGCNLAREDLREIFNYIRTNKPGHRIDLSHAILDHANISNVVADKAIFYHTSMYGTVARRAILNKAIFDTATLSGADFYEAQLPEGSFKNATCGGTRFDSTDLIRANFEGAWLDLSGGQTHVPQNIGSFRHAKAQHANFKNTRWGHYDTTYANFTGSDFIGSIKGDGITFENANMQDVIYSKDKKE